MRVAAIRRLFGPAEYFVHFKSRERISAERMTTRFVWASIGFGLLIFYPTQLLCPRLQQNWTKSVLWVRCGFTTAQKLFFESRVGFCATWLSAIWSQSKPQTIHYMACPWQSIARAAQKLQMWYELSNVEQQPMLPHWRCLHPTRRIGTDPTSTST